MKKFSRILLKISGEALLGKKNFGMDYDILHQIADEIAMAHAQKIEIVVVIGAGNIWRGAENSESGIERVPSDFIGMLGTIMNSIALQASLEARGIFTRVASAIEMPAAVEPYIRRRVIRHLEKNRVVICAAGTGNPFFTTDSAAALRALELDCDVILKATNVDGIYDSDPKKNPAAKKFTKISFDEVLEKNLRVMDATAIAQCRDNKMPIVVFKLLQKNNLQKILAGEKIGTAVF